MRPEGAENLREDVDHHLHWGLITRDASLQFPVSQQTSLGATGGVGPSMIPAISITSGWKGGHRQVLDIVAAMGRTRLTLSTVDLDPGGLRKRPGAREVRGSPAQPANTGQPLPAGALSFRLSATGFPEGHRRRLQACWRRGLPRGSR